MLGLFISIDIVLVLIFQTCSYLQMERKLSDTIYEIQSTDFAGATAQELPKWVTSQGVHIEPDRRDISMIPRHFSIIEHLPTRAQGLPRQSFFDVNAGPGIRLYQHVYLAHQGITFRVAVYAGDMLMAMHALAVLLIIELLMFISRTAKNTKLIHRSLEPITALTRAAETLGRAKPENLIPINVGAALDKGDIVQLRGALETINAARLDTRLDVDGTQRELRELAAAINGMLDRINDAYNAQVRFVSDASHELRTPIAVIQGYANMLDRWGKTDETTLQESIDAIRAEADSMKALVEQLLFLARGENRTIEPKPELFDLSELAEEVCDEAKLIDPTHEFRLVTAPAPVSVSADRGLIKQAARILVDNSIKYTDPGGTITLKAEVVGGEAQLSVTDTGIGIAEELLPNIFDRFVRADESRTRASGGAGLGLAIAKWIVDTHGGHLDALSRVGLGTRITIVLKSAEISGDICESENETRVESDNLGENSAPVDTSAPPNNDDGNNGSGEIKLTLTPRDAAPDPHASDCTPTLSFEPAPDISDVLVCDDTPDYTDMPSPDTADPEPPNAPASGDD